MVPVKGNCKIKPDREKFIKAEIIKLLDERDKYRRKKENAQSKKQLQYYIFHFTNAVYFFLLR